MLERLIIKNFVLVENCDISFRDGFTVITGETGAGKSVMLSALSLLLGDKADTSLVRLGASQAILEAHYTGDILNEIFPILQELGLETPGDELLIIRREIQASGKSRILLNGYPSPLSSLKKIAPYLLVECGQHAHLQLKNPGYMLSLVNQESMYLSSFQESLKVVESLQAEALRLQELLRDKPRKMEQLQERIEEIEGACIKEGEEEELFEKYQHLQSIQVFQEHIEYVLKALEDEPNGALSSIRRIISYIQRHQKTSTHFIPILEHSISALHELEEAAYTLQKTQQAEHAPGELEKLDTRLHLYARLKKRYGGDVASIQEFCNNEKRALLQLEQAEEELRTIQKAIEAAMKKCDQIADSLRKERKEKCSELEKKIESLVRSLGMPYATVSLRVVPTARSLQGDDTIEFFFSPNPGEREVEVHSSASGGELARLFLASLLATVRPTPMRTFLFDEIDANIGGATATIFAQKLSQLSKEHQVIAITHFAQVARQADSHFSIQKQVTDGRTVTTLAQLDTLESIEKELQRMLGEIPSLVQKTELQN